MWKINPLVYSKFFVNICTEGSRFSWDSYQLFVKARFGKNF